MKTITIPSYMSFQYGDVYLITEYRSGTVFHTRHIGFAEREGLETQFNVTNIPNVVISSLSTSLTRQPKITLAILSREEIEALAAKNIPIQSKDKRAY